ncbi:MAG TPA: hypothetical protein VFY34_02975 [Pyrinomonadaceae bacterium]|nr:hypothetical protein [Pyrinomonadaceae bacterium]
MTASLHNQAKLSILDYAFSLLDSADSPQDFTIVLHLSNPPSVERLRAGATSAMNRFPTSACTLKNRSWVCAANGRTQLPLNGNGKPSLESFVNDRFDVRRQTPVRQALFTDAETGTRLVTRFHHVAADGLSAALWLGHQLTVAYGLIDPETTTASFDGVTLRESQTSVRRSAFAFSGASDPLWTTNYVPSGARQLHTINFPANDLRERCRRARGFTYSDLLATCTLEVLSQWNQKHAPKRAQKIGLWYPLNIRGNPTSGFGNGTSRIRLYAQYAPHASLIDKAREVRKQVSWAIKHGEWVVPKVPLFTRLPRPIVAPLLNGYLKQPTVDMATAVFSHADRWAGDATEAFKYVTRIECVGLLHARQRLALNGATHQGQTWLTFTYDPALLDAGDVRELAGMYEEQIALARKELA